MTNERKKPFISKNKSKTKPQKNSRTPYKKSGPTSQKRVRRKHEVIPKPKMPLNKFLAHAGLGTRRETVAFIKKGDVTVNLEVITDPSYQVKEADEIHYKGDPIQNTKDRIYLLINKRSGDASALHTSDKSKNLKNYISDPSQKNLLPIGKLRKNTAGLMILSNDGDIANQLNDKKVQVENVYRLHTDQPLTAEHRDRLLAGIDMLGSTIKIEEVHYLDEEDRTQLGIKTYFEGDERLYKMMKELGYKVLKLDRVIYAGLSKKNLPRGTSRQLNAKEIVKLKHFNQY